MNNIYELTLIPQKINFSPNSLLEELYQNVITICSTAIHSVPMDRAFGVNATFLDEPMNISRAKLAADIIKAVRRFEPRVRITSIDFPHDEEGKVSPKIKFRVLKEG